MFVALHKQGRDSKIDLDLDELAMATLHAYVIPEDQDETIYLVDVPSPDNESDDMLFYGILNHEVLHIVLHRLGMIKESHALDDLVALRSQRCLRDIYAEGLMLQLGF